MTLIRLSYDDRLLQMSRYGNKRRTGGATCDSRPEFTLNELSDGVAIGFCFDEIRRRWSAYTGNFQFVLHPFSTPIHSCEFTRPASTTPVAAVWQGLLSMKSGNILPSCFMRPTASCSPAQRLRIARAALPRRSGDAPGRQDRSRFRL